MATFAEIDGVVRRDAQPFRDRNSEHSDRIDVFEDWHPPSSEYELYCMGLHNFAMRYVGDGPVYFACIACFESDKAVVPLHVKAWWADDGAGNVREYTCDGCNSKFQAGTF